MSTIVSTRSSPVVKYPESDGLPIAENTRQFRWIVTIQGGLDALFRDDVNVFVAGDLFWYPVEGNNTIRAAPDALVAFGRPKGDRGSYLQWLEGNIAPQVVFEVLSPGNRFGELLNKFQFYERYGVQEYYIWDPDGGILNGWTRASDRLQPIADMNGWTSPLLKVRFSVVDGELQLVGPDGKRFATYVELVEQREELTRRQESEQRARVQAQQRAERLAAQLKALGIEPEA